MRPLLLLLFISTTVFSQKKSSPEEIVRLVWEVEKQVDTVVALGVGTRCDEHGEDNVVAPVLERLGYTLHRAKTNIGLGRAVAQPQPQAETVSAQ